MTPTLNSANLLFSGTLSKRKATDYIVLHHAEAVKASVEDIHRWHLNNRWAGIGYHLYVRKDGTIWKGRPVDTVGAHCLNYNNNSIGVCVEGDYENKDTTMPEAQKMAVIELVSWLKELYPKSEIKAHKELVATACPGKYFPLDEIKNAVATPKPTVPKLKYNGHSFDVLLIDGVSYAPVRALAEAFGKKVFWDDKTKTVNIDD